MPKFNKSFAAVVMAVVSIAASAPDTNKSDLFDQESSSTSVTSNMDDAALPGRSADGTTRKTRITNDQVTGPGTGAVRGGRTGTVADRSNHG